MSWRDNISILIIDDDIELCRTLHRMLKSVYSVDYTTDITDMIHKLISNHYSVILLDYNLDPSLDGIQVAMDIHSLYPLTYIVMMSGYAEFEDIRRAINSGSIDYYLSKPIETEELMDAVEKAATTFIGNQETSLMLKGEENSDTGRQVLSNILSQTNYQSSEQVALSAVIISNNSIPIYSKFLDTSKLRSFTDTIFSGFMTALNMVGEEALSDENKVSNLIFGEMAICFGFHGDYQFSFIVHMGDFPDPDVISNITNEFVVRVTHKVTLSGNSFVHNRDDLAQIDQAVEELAISIGKLSS